MIKGVIFDMDGVLLDSEEWICKAAMAMFAEKGQAVQAEDFLPFVGTGEDRYLGGVAEKYGMDLTIDEAKARTYALYGEMVSGKLEPLAGVHDFIAVCRQKALKIAVASSADLVKVKINLKEINLPFESFDAVLNGQDVELKKPAPDIFLLAAERMGLKPTECLVVEDAVSGVTAALAAGCRCLGLTTSFSAEDLNVAEWTAPDLAHAPGEVLAW
ncbi:MAG: HAD family hydrolase [Planctomycetota bacterium]